MITNLTGFKGDPNDCYARALPDEPLFTLLARDVDAPRLVRLWADARYKLKSTNSIWTVTENDNGRIGEWVTQPHPDEEQIAHARYLAARMEVWRYENDGKWREPVRSLTADDM